jgi:pyridoxamine 5'-phosphate oxidase
MKLNEGPLVLNPDPLRSFEAWLADATAAGCIEPTAMTLATASRAGRPSARIVLFKGLSGGGFRFFTNYKSHKAASLAENPFAALVFHWQDLRRQIRIEGSVEKLSLIESNAYFQSRERGSQIGAWSSPQSQEVRSRDELVELIKQTEQRFQDASEIPCPPFWGGYRLRPERIEFWEERPSRLHERVAFVCENGAWQTHRLAP